VAAPKRAKPKAAPRKGAGGGPRGGGFWRAVGRLILIVVLIAVFAPPAGVLVYRFVPPPITILMVERLLQGHGMDYRWRPIDRISPDLRQAVVASEDQRFCEHHGFDFNAMEKAMAANERRPDKLRGGSTISQQTAKNVFLWPDRTYVRKALEAYFTVLIETIWGKRRIMEVYLNVAEMGPGIYGAQAAHLISVLPDPLKWRVAAPGAYVAKRTRRIDGAIGTVREDGLAGCVGR